MMYKIVLCCLIVSGAYAQGAISVSTKDRKGIDSIFKELDSIVQSMPADTMFGCNPSLIRKIEVLSGIPATDEGGCFVGKILFSLSDYNKWQIWREKKRKG